MWSLSVKIVIYSKVISFSLVVPFSPAACWISKSPKKTGWFAILLGYLILGWIMTSRFMVCFQIWGRNTKKSSFLFGQQNISFKNWLMGKVTGAEAIFFPQASPIISPAYQVNWLCWCVYVNKKTSLLCEKLILWLAELSLSLEASYLLW